MGPVTAVGSVTAVGPVTKVAPMGPVVTTVGPVDLAAVTNTTVSVGDGRGGPATVTFVRHARRRTQLAAAG